jgi:mono/diheme cytochrome c family protein
VRIRAFIVISIATALLFANPSWTQTSASQSSDVSHREQGKQVFTAQCGKCHDAGATKKLPDGTTLLARLAANKDPQARLATRLKSMSEQDRRDVELYVEDLITRFRAVQKP